MNSEANRFDQETWDELPAFLEHLPEPVRLLVWGDEQASISEREAARLARTLSERFVTIDYRLLPRRINYNYYPVLGVMRLEADETVDYGLRLIGLPAGVQMTSLIAAIQSASFQGMTSEARTRILLHKLQEQVSLELVTAAHDEGGTVMAQRLFNMAAVSPLVRSFLIMGDAFPDAVVRYSVNAFPHTIINGRVHVEGVVSEATLLQHIAAALM